MRPCQRTQQAKGASPLWNPQEEEQNENFIDTDTY
jgi:hypothetical protein